MRKVILTSVLFSAVSFGATTGSFVKTVTSAGTAEALSTTIGPVGLLSCQPEPDNTGNVYYGGSDVDSTNGVEVSATGKAFNLPGGIRGGSITNDINPDHVFIDVSVSGDGAECFWTRY